MDKVKINKFFKTFCVLLLISFLTACGTVANQGPHTDSLLPHERLEIMEAPSFIQELYEENKAEEKNLVIFNDDKVYLLILMGEVGSGGHYVILQQLRDEENEVKVNYQFNYPKPGELVTEAIEYPYLLISLDSLSKEIRFAKQIDKEQMMTNAYYYFNSITPGAKLGELLVVEADIGDVAARVGFEGKIQLSGSFHYDPEDMYLDGVSFVVDEQSAYLLPKWVKDERMLWFAFRNDSESLNIFGITPGQALKGEATILIDQYTIRYAPTEIWNEALLLEVNR